ncbi:MAG: hypothetical protein KGS72_02495 [Cyanobacteria bacterium REEB67]|nr:hypothetical protein [Cyanobacteria bacterium REEB67]
MNKVELNKADNKKAEIKVMGIRHHGPGSARSVAASLAAFEPDCILIEGPPEGDHLIKYVNDQGMAPPVALLVYAQEHPRQACYYPFANFSPEWQALSYGAEKGIACRFMDLPQANWLALSERKLEKLREKMEAAAADAERSGEANVQSPEQEQDSVPTRRESLAPEDAPRALTLKQRIRLDPIGALAHAAGFSDGERWWEQLIEQRQSIDDNDIFDGITEAMAALREELSEPDRILIVQREDDSLEDERLYEDLDERVEPLREAHMRQTLRQAIKEDCSRIAIICGAWHAPAFSNMPPAKNDQLLLKGLPKIKVEATWIPWTHGRLQFNSGYGAGVESPGYYEHLFKCENLQSAEESPAPSLSWLVRVAHLLREEDLSASSAQVIDAFRLAEALAAMRELTQPGLDELNESTVAVLCGGNLAPLSLIYKKLIVGERLGDVPPEIPGTPLQRDLTRQQTRLRLKPEVSSKIIELDLRKAFDLEKSELLHRLQILDINWGEKQELRSKTSTFHEQWDLEWQPELSIAVVEAGVWGRSIEQAASARAIDQAQKINAFAPLVKLLEQTLDAALPEALPTVMSRVDSEAATLSDILELMKALPTLAKIARYGNVRSNFKENQHIQEIIDALVTRICINLPAACASLDDDAASVMDQLIAQAYQSISLLDQKHHKEAFYSALTKLAEQVHLHGQIAGRATRLLFDCNYYDADTTFTRMNHALSHASEAAYAGQWLMGFLAGSGLVLIHDHRLFLMVDQWLSQLNDEHFVETLPLLRRTFSSFTSPERLSIGELAKSTTSETFNPNQRPEGDGMDLDAERLAPVFATLRLVFGLEKMEGRTR